MSPEQADELIRAVGRWVEARGDCDALAVAGSWARGNPRPDSDLDLIVLVSDPERYGTDAAWLGEIALVGSNSTSLTAVEARYGAVTSWHVRLAPEAELELTFAAPSWADTSPIDPGTYGIVSDAFRIVVDKDGRLDALVSAVRRQA